MFGRGLKIVLGAAVLSCLFGAVTTESAQAQVIYAGGGYAPVYYGGYYGPTYVVRTVRYIPPPSYVPAWPCPPPPPVVYYGTYPTYRYGFGFNVNIRHNDRDDHRHGDRQRGDDRPRGGQDRRGGRR